MKKTLILILNLVMVLCMSVRPMEIAAEESRDFSDSSYWNGLCIGSVSLSASEQNACTAYASYLETQNQKLQGQLADTDKQKNQLDAKNLVYADTVASYNKKAESLNWMVGDLTVQVEAAEKHRDAINQEIADNKIKIDAKNKEIEKLRKQVGERMVQQQESMRVNQFVDIILGARTFADFIRIADCLADIYNYDSRTLKELTDSVDEMNRMQEKLVSDQKELDELLENLAYGQETLVLQQDELTASLLEAQKAQAAYDEQVAGMDENSLKLLHAIEQNRASITAIRTSINASAAAASRPSASEKPASTSPPEKTPDTAHTEPEKTPDTKPEQTAEPDTPENTPESTVEPEPTQEPEEEYTPPARGPAENPYYGGWGNCVWGAWELVYETLGIALPGWGYSTWWLEDAQASGYATGSEPRVYSVAVYDGHVAFVTAVDGDMVYIKEGNYLGNYYERWVSKDILPWTNQVCRGYIYLN